MLHKSDVSRTCLTAFVYDARCRGKTMGERGARRESRGVVLAMFMLRANNSEPWFRRSLSASLQIGHPGDARR